MAHSLSKRSQFSQWDYLLCPDYVLCPAIRVLCPEAGSLAALTSADCIVSDAPALSRWFGVRLHVVLFWPILICIFETAVTLLAYDPAVDLDAVRCLVPSILAFLVLTSSFCCGCSAWPLRRGIHHASWFHPISRRQCQVQAVHVAYAARQDALRLARTTKTPAVCYTECATSGCAPFIYSRGLNSAHGCMHA